MMQNIKQAKHFIYYLIALAVGKIVLFIPRKAALRLGSFLGDIAFLLSRKERAIAVRNLSIAFGAEKSSRDILTICHNCFRNLGKGLMEFLQFPRLKAEKLSSIITVEGKQNIDESFQKGKGVIALSAHFGNWELLGAALQLSGYPTNPIIRPAKLKWLDTLVNRYREGTGLRCISRGASVKAALLCLKKNELLGILADIDTRVDGVFVGFFGRPAYTPRGPVSIALKTGAVLLPTFIIRQKDDTHRLIINKGMKLKTTGDIEEDIRLNTEAYTKIIESYIREYPEQWVWFHERWKTAKSP